MATLYYGRISSVGEGMVSVTLPDRENQVVQRVPLLTTFYGDMLKPGEKVAVLFEVQNGQLGKGVVLGKLMC